MKQLCAKLLVIAVLGSLLAMAGCASGSTWILTDNVCVDIDDQTDRSRPS
jgi:hypothetical protein